MQNTEDAQLAWIAAKVDKIRELPPDQRRVAAIDFRKEVFSVNSEGDPTRFLALVRQAF